MATPRRPVAGNDRGAADDLGKIDAANDSKCDSAAQQIALPAIAERINAEHQAAIGAARTAIGHAVECGKLLLQVKQEVGHGNWLNWVAANLSFGHRQAQKYLRLAAYIERHPNAPTNSHLSIDGALAAIAEPEQKPTRPRLKPKWEPLAQPERQKLQQLTDPPPGTDIDPRQEVIETADREAFQEPPPGRPRLNLERMEAIRLAYHQLMRGEQNAFARWVLEHQLRQTDLTPQQKAGLGRVLEALTTYTEAAAP
jgi:hypothetical protein